MLVNLLNCFTNHPSGPSEDFEYCIPWARNLGPSVAVLHSILKLLILKCLFDEHVSGFGATIVLFAFMCF